MAVHGAARVLVVVRRSVVVIVPMTVSAAIVVVIACSWRRVRTRKASSDVRSPHARVRSAPQLAGACCVHIAAKARGQGGRPSMPHNPHHKHSHHACQP